MRYSDRRVATGSCMQIWRLLTAIEAASEGVEEVAYWFTRILEDADQPPDVQRFGLASLSA